MPSKRRAASDATEKTPPVAYDTDGFMMPNPGRDTPEAAAEPEAEPVIIPPDGSLCQSCVLFDGGNCPRLRYLIYLDGGVVPHLTHCPDYTPTEADE